MPVTKAEVEQRAALAAKVRELKTRIKRLNTLKTGRDSDFWKDLKDELEISVKVYEARRDDVLVADDLDPMKAYADARGCSRAIQAIKHVYARVDSSDFAISRMNDEIAECNSRIHAIDAKSDGKLETMTNKGVV